MGYDRSVDYKCYRTLVPIKKQMPDQGPFVFRDSDGGYLEGKLIDGKPAGRLRYVSAQGHVMEGSCRGGVWEGACTETFADGTVIEGSRKEGKWNGPCRIRFADGLIMEGIKKNGLWDGDFTMTEPGGMVIAGVRKGENYIGSLKQRDREGNVFICPWKNEGWNGEGTLYFSGGAVLFAEFIDGRPVGGACVCFPNGGIYSGDWDGGIYGEGIFSCTCKRPGFYSMVYSGNWIDNEPSDAAAELTIKDTSLGGDYRYLGGIKGWQLSGKGKIFYIENTRKDSLKVLVAKGIWQGGKRKSLRSDAKLCQIEKLFQEALACMRQGIVF